MSVTAAYTVSSSASACGTSFCGCPVVCLGEVVEPSVEAVQALFVRRRIPLARQLAEWNSLIDAYPDPCWAEQCLAAAERVQAILLRRQALQLPVAPAHPPSAGRAPQNALLLPPEAHFIWLGLHNATETDRLTSAITSLAADAACIAKSPEQQRAFRLALGYVVRADERSLPVEPVRWLATDNMLHHLVASLFDMHLLTCAGGEALKWRLTRQVFRHADGSLIGPAIKNNTCRSADKRDLLRRHFLDKVRPVSASLLRPRG